MQALTGRFGWRLSRRQQVQQFCRAVVLTPWVTQMAGLGVD